MNDGSNNDRKAERGKPGTHAGKRVRWRSVWRETRKSNRAAVAGLIEAEIAMKRRYTRGVLVARIIRNVLIGAGFAAVLYLRCAP